MGGIHEESPDHMYQKEKAKVLYFVGCVASFFLLFREFLRPSFKSWTKVKWTSLLLRRGVVLWFSSDPDGDADKMQKTDRPQKPGKGPAAWAETVVFGLSFVLSHMEGKIQDQR